MRVEALGRTFTIIGENVHTTRIVQRNGRLVGETADGGPVILFTDRTGARRELPIPAAVQQTADFVEGRVKHVAIAIRGAMAGPEPEAALAREYLRMLVERQVAAGADYLDLNVDEISVALSDQVAAMRWLVAMVEAVAAVPVSVDSSNVEIIRAGLEASSGRAGAPMLNSASLERRDALELAAEGGGPVIVTAAGAAGMPTDAAERVANATAMIEAALAKGIPLERLYVDSLVFPISVDGRFGSHSLDAWRTLRARYGPAIHLTGGMSNVSFGLPSRRLINDAFLWLAVEAGADSGIIDPIANDLERVFGVDRSARPFQLAVDVLTGVDRNCRAYLRAYRAGELAWPQPAVGAA